MKPSFFTSSSFLLSEFLVSEFLLSIFDSFALRALDLLALLRLFRLLVCKGNNNIFTIKVEYLSSYQHLMINLHRREKDELKSCLWLLSRPKWSMQRIIQKQAKVTISRKKTNLHSGISTSSLNLLSSI